MWSNFLAAAYKLLVRNFHWVSLAFGLWILLNGVDEYHEIRSYRQNSPSTIGHVTNILKDRSPNTTSYRVVAEYTVNDKQYNVVARISSGVVPVTVGQPIKVFYDKDFPTRAELDLPLEWLNGLIGTFLSGTLITVIALFYVFRDLLTRWLRTYGRPITATIKEYYLDTRYSIKDHIPKHPWVIVAQWYDPVTQTMRTFKSERIWPETELHDLEGTPVRVFIAPTNSRWYWLDTSLIPQE